MRAVRRLALARQGLAGKPPSKHGPEEIIALMKEIRYLQLDPVGVVAPSHQLVLWSRLGNFELSDLDRLMWKEKRLFEYWAHKASIVLMEDYPLYAPRMKAFGHGSSIWSVRLMDWLRANRALQHRLLARLRAEGPLPSRAFEDKTRTGRPFGWGSMGDVARMFLILFHQGKIMVAGRDGTQKLWDVTDKVLPDHMPRRKMTPAEVEYEGAQMSLHALGAATPWQIGWHFLYGRYPEMKRTLKRLEEDSKIVPVKVTDGAVGKGQCYVHSKDLEELQELESADREPRTTLLSPFDNMITDRERTKALFGFDYKIEIYTPGPKRKFGYYVLPILQGERLVGRVDAAMDRTRNRLVVKAVYAENDAPKNRKAGEDIASSLGGLSEFLGADEVSYSAKVPAFWRSSLG